MGSQYFGRGQRCKSGSLDIYYMRGVSRGAVLDFSGSGAPDLHGALRGENVWTSPRTAPRPSGAAQAFLFCYSFTARDAAPGNNNGYEVERE